MSSPIHYQDSINHFRKRKARFSFSEIHILLDEVRKHRSLIVGKFNRGVPTEVKKRTWAEITARVNEIGECQREVLEVIKKWSDLKCDTKRKVSAMLRGAPPNKVLLSRMTRDLTQVERIVHQILQMEKKGDRSGSGLGPLEDDDDGPEDIDDFEDDMMGLSSSPNGMDVSTMPPPPPYSTDTLPLPGAKEDQSIPNSGSSRDSSQPSLDAQNKAPVTEDTETQFLDSDDEQKDDTLPSTQTVKPAGDHQKNNGVPRLFAGNSTPFPTPSSFSATLPSSSHTSHNQRPSVLQNAAFSLQEQHATNMLLETVSRSLELLSESVQQLAETQHEFIRESLQLQRETVQVLRDFTGGAIALVHDKLNGRPAL